MKPEITRFKFLFTLPLIFLYLTSQAQTVCGEDDGCSAYYLVIAENTASGCQNEYNITADFLDDGKYISISVAGADFIYNGEYFLDGQSVDFSSGVVKTKYCDEGSGQNKTFFALEGTLQVANTSHPYTISVNLYSGDILQKECFLYEPNDVPCFSANGLCVYKNAGGALQAFVHPMLGQQGGYDYQWQKWDWETKTWQTVSSGSSVGTSVELPIAAEFAFRSDRYRFRLRVDSSSPWLNSSSAYVRYIPQDCPPVVP